VDLVEWSEHLEEVLHRPPLIKVNGKQPLDQGWPTGPFEDPDGWRDRLRNHHGNVGLVLGRGMLAADVDSYKVGAGALDALVDAVGLETDTVTQITGRGGQHLFYSYDPALHVPSVPLTPRGFPAIEIKADGGQVIVEPSTHPDTGRPYAFEDGAGPGEIEIRPAPEKLLKLIGASEATLSRRSKKWERLAPDELEDLDNLNIECVRILTDHFDAHDPVRLVGGTIGVWRPGKTNGSLSFTFGFIGPGIGKCWTDDWAPFEQGKVYDLGQLRRMAGITHTIDVPDVVAIPQGYRVWEEGDENLPAPELAKDAYHGLIGDFLSGIEGQVEAHPAAIGAHLLPCFGTLFGRTIAYSAGFDLQHPKLYFAVVGPTSSGGKGAALNVSMAMVRRIDPHFEAHHSIAGIGSGETLIYEMRDAGEDEDPVETRRIVLDAELSRVLRVARREGSILGDILRTAFDSHPLRHSTRKDKVTVSSRHHLSLVAAITPGELCALTEHLALLNGFANRYLYVWSEIPDLLPHGGHNEVDLAGLADRFNTARRQVLERPVVNETRPYVFADDARSAWEDFYFERRRGLGDTEAMRAITGRQVAHAARLALIYAALDGDDQIRLVHLRAGIAWADYSVGTICKVFTASASGRAGQLLTAIREKGTDGLDGVGQDAVFSKNLRVGELALMRDELEQQHLIVTGQVATSGRPRLLSIAISPLGQTDKRING
jgi:hypothetical protein